MQKRISMKQAILYRLMQKRLSGMFIPVYDIIGEIYCKELEKWGFVSFEVSARLSEMYRDNPTLLEREWQTGRLGAKYYAYRIAQSARPKDIKDPSLKKFYYLIKENKHE